MFDFALCKQISSTQLRLIDKVKEGFNKKNFALASINQNAGIGTNSRIWLGEKNDMYNKLDSFKNEEFSDLDFIYYGDYKRFNEKIYTNLYISFFCDFIPSDLALQSISIYYASILKYVLKAFNSKLFVKWPNDLYLNNKKIGGVLCNKINDKIICGIGLNIVSSPKENDILDKKISLEILIKAFLDTLSSKLSWEEIFKEYKQDFELSRHFYFKYNDEVLSLENAKLYKDGSILVDDKRIYSLR